MEYWEEFPWLSLVMVLKSLLFCAGAREGAGSERPASFWFTASTPVVNELNDSLRGTRLTRVNLTSGKYFATILWPRVGMLLRVVEWA